MFRCCWCPYCCWHRPAIAGAHAAAGHCCYWHPCVAGIQAAAGIHAAWAVATAGIPDVAGVHAAAGRWGCWRPCCSDWPERLERGGPC